MQDNACNAHALSVTLLFLIPALGGLLFGYDIGSTAYAVKQMQNSTLSGITWSENASDPVVKGLIVSATSAGAFIGSFIVFAVADTIGRKRELQTGSLLYLVGAIFQYFCCNDSLDAIVGIACLILSRVLYGIGIAFSMHGAPTYIAEMSPPNLRGLLVSMKEAMIVVGILCGYLIGWVLEDTPRGWAYVYGCSSFLSGIMFFGTFTIPFSARWLLLRGREDEAFLSLQWVFKGDDDNIMDIYKKMKNLVASQAEAAVLRGSADKSIFATRWRGALTAGVGLVILQQVTGQPSILSYATPILDDAGLESYSSVLVGAFKLVATLFSVFYVDNYGRRKLLFIGNGLMLVALVTLSISFCVDDSDSSTNNSGDIGFKQIVTLVGMFVYIGGYQVGFGPIAWLMISECFPLEIRGQAVAFAVSMNFFWNLVVQFGLPTVQEQIGNASMFIIFSTLTAYSIFFVHKYVPETKGLSLEQIESFFEQQHRKMAGNNKKTAETPLITSDFV